MFEEDILPDGTEVAYYARGQVVFFFFLIRDKQSTSEYLYVIYIICLFIHLIFVAEIVGWV